MLENYIQECLSLKNEKKSKISELLLNCQNNLSPNDYQFSFFEKLEHKSKEPMQIAIIGQFSSGKSTFLNALLGQDILPTGITPITSKVCKICYGEDYILEILYKDGAKVLQSVEFLHNLNRENSKNIDHFCLYAPILLLKEINFLDTPGFNSQNADDTKTTLKILNSTDGIIWLTLIDNAGKSSEIALLKEFSTHFAQKSLCVLNQKDRLKDEKEVQTSLTYAKDAFSGIFFNCIPISAKMALQARLNTQEKFLQTKLINLTQNLQSLSAKLETSSPSEILNSLNKILSQESSLKKELESLDTKNAEKLMQESNMPLIFEFLNNTIKPKAKIAKIHTSIKKLKEMHILLNLQYHKIAKRYKNLQNILNKSLESFKQSTDSSLEKEQQIFNDLYLNLDSNLDSFAQKIYNSLESIKMDFNYTKKTLLSQKILQNSKEVTILPLEKIRIELQNNDTKLARDYKAISVKIKTFLDHFKKSIEAHTNMLESSINKWQHDAPKIAAPFIKAQNSDGLLQFNTILQNTNLLFILDFKHNANECVAYLQSELSVLSNFLSLSYENALSFTLNNLDLKIKNAINKHAINQDEFALFTPTLNNVRDYLNEAFCFEAFQARLFGPMNCLKKAYSKILNDNAKTTQNKIEFLESQILSLKQEMDKIKQNLCTIKEFLQKVES